MQWISRRCELALPKRFDVLTVCSEEDRSYLGCLERTHVIPNGAHAQAPRQFVDSAPPRIGFIGNCTFKLNEDGLYWFISKVWPRSKEPHSVSSASVSRPWERWLSGEIGSEISMAADGLKILAKKLHHGHL